MMRVAVLSDIHGNLPALLSVLADAIHEGVTQVWCLGDIVGYGPYSLECYEELRDLENKRGIPVSAWIAGNHDWGLAGKLSLEPRFFPQVEAKWALEQTELITSRDEETRHRFDAMREFLAGLPTFAESPQVGVWLMHGWVAANESRKMDVTGLGSYIKTSVDDAWKAENSWKAMSELAEKSAHGRPSLILAGHTHQPMLRRRLSHDDWRLDSPSDKGLDPPAGWPEACPKCGRGSCQSIARWRLSIILPDDPALVNPGSVGQPRDGCPAASYVILDLGHRHQVTFKRVGYAVQDTINAFSRLARKPDGSIDTVAMYNHVKELRNRLMRGG